VSDALLSAHDLALVDAVAERVFELLAERGAPQGRSRLVSAGELAEVLGVSRDWVYRHAEELGAVRVGGAGPRSEHGGRRLRFDVDQALATQTSRQASEASQPPDLPVAAGRSRRALGVAPPSDVPRLPIRGRTKAA
jgi:predicted DNA-binding transcriptional regulator AlpA